MGAKVFWNKSPKSHRKNKAKRKDTAYLKWVAQKLCAITGSHNIEVHHVRTPLHRTKDDRRVIPLDAKLHDVFHDSGETAFFNATLSRTGKGWTNDDMLEEALKLRAEYEKSFS